MLKDFTKTMCDKTKIHNVIHPKKETTEGRTHSRFKFGSLKFHRSYRPRNLENGNLRKWTHIVFEISIKSWSFHEKKNE